MRERTAGNSETVYSDDEQPSPSYWQAVGLLIAQSDGLLAGYSARLSELTPEVGSLERLTKWDFLVLNALGDMDDLLGRFRTDLCFRKVAGGCWKFLVS